MSNLKFRRKGFYQSSKAGTIFCDSSYELKAATILDADSNVLFYENHIAFHNKNGDKRITDFLITYKDGSKKLVEVKPQKRLLEFQEQIDDNQLYANQNGYNFEVWTELNLGFTETSARHWADEFFSEQTGIDYANIRKQRNCERSKKHYRKSLAGDKITFFCEHCQEEHTQLTLTYEKNIKKNGRHICKKESDKKPKPSKNKKVNPYADQGKKQCNRCEEIKLLKEFGVDKTKFDGRATRCKVCRAAVATAKYQAKMGNNK